MTAVLVDFALHHRLIVAAILLTAAWACLLYAFRPEEEPDDQPTPTSHRAGPSGSHRGEGRTTRRQSRRYRAGDEYVPIRYRDEEQS